MPVIAFAGASAMSTTVSSSSTCTERRSKRGRSKRSAKLSRCPACQQAFRSKLSRVIHINSVSVEIRKGRSGEYRIRFQEGVDWAQVEDQEKDKQVEMFKLDSGGELELYMSSLLPSEHRACMQLAADMNSTATAAPPKCLGRSVATPFSSARLVLDER